MSYSNFKGIQQLIANLKSLEVKVENLFKLKNLKKQQELLILNRVKIKIKRKKCQ